MATKRATQKTESRFYIVKTVKETQKKIEDKAKTYNEKYVKNQLNSGKEFITELKANPVKKIDGLIDDSKDAIKKTREDRYNAWKKVVKTARKDAKVRFSKLNTESKKVYRGVESDAKLVIKEVIEMSKKNIDRLPMKKNLEEKISKSIESIPSKLNLPSRKEFDNLANGLNGASKKVYELSKQVIN